MKKLLLLALLASCTSKPAEDPTQKAISALLQKSMNGPTTYQPVRWGKKFFITVSDSISGHRSSLSSRIQTINERIKIDSTSVARYGNLSHAQSLLKSTRKDLSRLKHQRDSLHQTLKSIVESADTSRLGYYITHAFRAKNQMGALVLDSAEFYVDKKGRLEKTSN
jgi:hypothetical protein